MSEGKQELEFTSSARLDDTAAGQVRTGTSQVSLNTVKETCWHLYEHLARGVYG